MQRVILLLGCLASLLLGDAAGFLDPITGGGMTQALMTAELLAGYVQQGLDDVDDCDSQPYG